MYTCITITINIQYPMEVFRIELAQHSKIDHYYRSYILIWLLSKFCFRNAAADDDWNIYSYSFVQ